MKAPFYYRAYGLTIASDVALPLPETGRRCEDLFIHEKRNGALSHGNDEEPWKLEIWKDNEALLAVPSWRIRFGIQEGNRCLPRNHPGKMIVRLSPRKCKRRRGAAYECA
jgi:hypothetical protein